MQFYLDIDPVDVSLTAYGDDVVSAGDGGAPEVFTIEPDGYGPLADGLGRQLSVKGNAATNHSAKTLTIVGTDADDRAQTEVINMPNGTATVETVKYFKTLVSLTLSADTGADSFDIGVVDEAVSRTIALDADSSIAPTLQVIVTGTINWGMQVSVQHPLQGVDQNALAWVADGTLTAETASQLEPLSKVGLLSARVIVNTFTNGARLQVFGNQPR
jgi:hypothetical protein